MYKDVYLLGWEINFHTFKVESKISKFLFHLFSADPDLSKPPLVPHLRPDSASKHRDLTDVNYSGRSSTLGGWEKLRLALRGQDH